MPKHSKTGFCVQIWKNVSHAERSGVGNELISPFFEVKTLARLLELFPVNVLLKVHSSGDATLITPWVSLNADISVKFNGGKYTTFESGKLGIPIKEQNDSVLVFFVCGGLDDEDNIPTWVAEFQPKDMSIPVNPDNYLGNKGTGTISLNKKDHDWTYIVKDQDVHDGDFLKIRSDYYEVRGICRDGYEQNYDCVRFCHDFQKKH